VGEFKKTIRLKFHKSLIVFSLSFDPAAETVDRNISGPNSTKNVKWIKSIKKPTKMVKSWLYQILPKSNW
jgi:hypothetical protein